MSSFQIKKDPIIVAIFNEAQSDTSHIQLVLQLNKMFNEMNSEDFILSFITCLKISFNVSADYNFIVEKIVEFAVKFIITLVDENTSEHNNCSKKILYFCENIFKFLEESHTLPSQIIRKRVCQFISKFLLRMSPDACLEYFICDIIIRIMKERMKDKVPIIRMQAVLAIYRLQDEDDKNCFVTKSLLHCMETDTSAEVRKLALSKVSLKHKNYIKVIIDRVDDVSEKVRKEAYLVFSKLHIKQLTIEQRKRILYTGLYDNDETVKNTVKKNLLPSWLKRMDGNYLNFLKALDLNAKSMEMMTKAVMALFENDSMNIVLEILKTITDEIKLISYENLSSESAFLWRCCIFHYSEMVSEFNNYQWEQDKSYDVIGAGLLPDLSVFCDYIKIYYDANFERLPNETLWKKQEQEFIIVQLIELCKVYDYADEAGRKELRTVCLDLLRHVEMETIKPIIELYFMLHTQLHESISKITELINDILYPSSNDNNKTEKSASDCTTTTKPKIVLDSIQMQNIEFKIAQLEVRLVELKDAQEEAVLTENYLQAQHLKEEIHSIQSKVNDLKAQISSDISSVPENSAMVESMMLEPNNEEFADMNNLNLVIVERCLVILKEMLHLSFIKHLIPELRTLFQLVVLPACKSLNSLIAPLAVEVLGSFCLRDKTLAKEYFTMFFALCKNSDVCVSALKVIFDFLLCFGPSSFDINSLDDYENHENNKQSSHSDINNSEDYDEDEINEDVNKSNLENELSKCNVEMISGYAFVSVLVNFLDDEFVEARFVVVHGLCQLMATGKLKSTKVLTRLILIWFHPTSRESVEIRDCLNFFFPFFAKRCLWALQLFENAFVPTMKTLFNAPVHSPLTEVDQKSVVKVLCDITSPNFVEENVEFNENIHCNLAVLISNYILDLRDTSHQAVLLKALDYLYLKHADPSLLATLDKLLEKIVKKFRRKNVKKLMNETMKLKKKFSNFEINQI